MTSESLDVDVLIAVREPAPWLGETLFSLVNQTFKDFRLVLAVHGADEVSSGLAKQYFPDALILHCSQGLTLPEVRAYGLSRCSAPFVALSDADDVSFPNRLRHQHEYLSKHTSVAMVAAPMAMIDVESRLLPGKRGAHGSSLLMLRLLSRNVIGQSSVMLRREVAEQSGSYRRHSVGVEDYDLWLRIGARAQIRVMREMQVAYRIHPAQTSSVTQISPTGIQNLLESRIALARSIRLPKWLAEKMHRFWVRRQRISTDKMVVDL